MKAKRSLKKLISKKIDKNKTGKLHTGHWSFEVGKNMFGRKLKNVNTKTLFVTMGTMMRWPKQAGTSVEARKKSKSTFAYGTGSKKRVSGGSCFFKDLRNIDNFYRVRRARRRIENFTCDQNVLDQITSTCLHLSLTGSSSHFVRWCNQIIRFIMFCKITPFRVEQVWRLRYNNDSEGHNRFKWLKILLFLKWIISKSWTSQAIRTFCYFGDAALLRTWCLSDSFW